MVGGEIRALTNYMVTGIAMRGKVIVGLPEIVIGMAVVMGLFVRAEFRR